ncbi:U32 family peptidase [Fusobacterium sp.]|uniref:peptidase U32 family protein n=1 Tax=Fusobacterium sp. TaxID=68766 RepID=UPI00261DDC7F|nr:U32 family peptidase [Fusobacterium sp.]
MKIVAPAGNMERFYSAVNAGADEIYMGLKGFGARRNAENFTLEEFKQALDYAHERGTRIFLTLNTLMKNVEIEFLYQNFKVLYEHGLDAVILQDLGYFRFLKENFPDIDYHGSTQMTVANHVEANYLKSLGFKRVVLPREMSFEEIKKIRENTDIELEIFVSGALCVCYSGNCYMSSFIGGRSGNRGMCAQPCRKPYTSSEGKSGYLLSPKDQLMSFDEIKKLKDIGINSIKIEGRMKEKTYVYEAVSYFKNLIDEIKVEERVSSIFNRGYSKGYFYQKRDNIMNRDYPANMGKPIGIISGKELLLEEDIMLGDGISYISKDYEILGGDYINRIEKKNRKEKYRTAEKGDRIILINAPKGAKYIFKNYDKEVNDDIESKLKNSNKKKDVYFDFIGRNNECPILQAKTINNFGEEISVTIMGENKIEEATKRGAEKENVIEKLSETGDTVFKVRECNVYIDNNIFLPLSVLKQIRRDALENLRMKLIESHRRILERKDIFRINIEKDIPKHCELSVMVTNDRQEKVVRELGINKIYRRGVDIARENNLDKIDLNSQLATNLYQVLENKNQDVTVGWNLNIGNIYSLNEYAKIENVKTVIITPELSFEQIENIGKVPVRKALLGYSKLKGMYLELPVFKDKEIITNEQGDNFIVRKNELGNDEIYFEKPLNVLSQVKRLGKIGIDEVVIELLDETDEEIRFLIQHIDRKENSYSPYNYERGVF